MVSDSFNKNDHLSKIIKAIKDVERTVLAHLLQYQILGVMHVDDINYQSYYQWITS